MFSSLQIHRSAYNTIQIAWDYSHTTVFPASWSIRISVSQIREGGYQSVVTLSTNQVAYQHTVPRQKWLSLFYKIQLLDNDDVVVDERILEIARNGNQFVRKMRSKYDIYLRGKLGNKAILFKKKSFGVPCSCTQPSICPICYGAGFGNDNVLGLSNLQFDGWLKKNIDGDLEFYKNNCKFYSYEIDGEEYSIKTGDEFMIEGPEGEMIQSLAIKKVEVNSLILDFDQDAIKNLQNSRFSVYQLSEKYSEFITTRVVQDGDRYRLYHNNSADNYDTILIGNIIYGAHKEDDYIVIHTSDDTYLKSFDVFYLCNTEDLFLTTEQLAQIEMGTGVLTDESVAHTVEYSYDVSSVFFSKFNYQTIWFKGFTPDVNDRIYIEYYYDAEREFIIDDVRTYISEGTEQKMVTGLFTVTDVTNDICEVNLETLTEYNTIADSPGESIYNAIIQRFARQNLNAAIYRTRYGRAHNRLVMQLKPGMTIKLPHTNILKDTFAGCGVLLLNLREGTSYKGDTWDGSGYTTPGDIEVDPDKGIINTKEIPEGTYEIAYIYELNKLHFDSYLYAINPKYDSENNFKSVDGWQIVHPKLKNKKLEDKSVVIFDKGINEEFKINSYIDFSGTVKMGPGTIDASDLWDSLTEFTKFHVTEPNTGGFYKGIEGYISFRTEFLKNSAITLIGTINENDNVCVVEYYPPLNIGDLIYDVGTQIFYEIMVVTAGMFNRHATFQLCKITEAEIDEQNLYFKLLERDFADDQSNIRINYD